MSFLEKRKNPSSLIYYTTKYLSLERFVPQLDHRQLSYKNVQVKQMRYILENLTSFNYRS